MDARVPFTTIQSAFGVAGVVTRPDEDPIDTTVVWDPRVPELVPGGEFMRADRPRVVAINRDEVPTLKVGTVIEAPEREGDTSRRWVVTDIDQQDVDHHRAFVRLADENE